MQPTTQQPTQKPKMPHNIIVENRHTVTATGITRIISYDAASAMLETELGVLTIGGSDISVSELSIVTGELKVSGNIEYLQYAQPSATAGGFFRRLAR